MSPMKKETSIETTIINDSSHIMEKITNSKTHTDSNFTRNRMTLLCKREVCLPLSGEVAFVSLSCLGDAAIEVCCCFVGVWSE